MPWTLLLPFSLYALSSKHSLCLHLSLSNSPLLSWLFVVTFLLLKCFLLKFSHILCLQLCLLACPSFYRCHALFYSMSLANLTFFLCAKPDERCWKVHAPYGSIEAVPPCPILGFSGTLEMIWIGLWTVFSIFTLIPFSPKAPPNHCFILYISQQCQAVWQSLRRTGSVCVSFLLTCWNNSVCFGGVQLCSLFYSWLI